MVSFTLDTNCMLDIDEGRPAAKHVLRLAAAHAAGEADVALAAVSASENQKTDKYITSFSQFKERASSLGLGHLNYVLGLVYLDLSFFDVSMFADPEGMRRDREIHEVLFPSIPFEWSRFAAENGLVQTDIKTKAGKKWRNAFCDRQIYWAHENGKRDVFVTSNLSDFKKLIGHPKFPNARIMTPQQAVDLLPPEF